MSYATRDRAPAHARIFATWVVLPAWRALSPVARALLVEMLARFRPGQNGALEWPVRKAANAVGVSKATAARALIELERNGWLSVTRVAAFGGRPKPATYLLAMFGNDLTGEPPSRAFEHAPGEAARIPRPRNAVPPMRLNGFARETRQSQQRDKPEAESEPINISDALAQSPAFMALQRNGKAPTSAG